MYHGIAKYSGEFELLKLEDDEYVGEEISVIYDEEYNVIMIQRNRNSLSPAGLEKYFSGVINNGDQIQLLPIPMPDELKTINQNQKFKKLTLSFSPTNIDEELLNNENMSISRIIKGTKELGALKVTIDLSLGNSKRVKTLNKREILELGKLDNYAGFNKIELKKLENEDTRIETVDLITGKLNDMVTIEVSRINPIKHDRIIVEMSRLYLEKKNILSKLFEGV